MVLTKEGVIINLLKPKYLFGENELVNFNTIFWTIDKSCFVHPRNKAQIPFLLAIYCWTGARIGAFFPDGKEKNRHRWSSISGTFLDRAET